MKILDGSYFAEKHLYYMYTTLEKQKTKPKKLAGGPRASSSSSRLLMQMFLEFIFFIKTLDSINYWYILHLGRLKVFWSLLDQIVITYNGG